MKRLWSLAVVVFALLPLARAEEKPADNPFKDAKVGDWIEYKTVTTLNEAKLDGKVKMTVTARTEKEVTVKSVIFSQGLEMAGPETKVDLTKPYDPLSTSTLPKGTDVKVEKVAEGKEKVKV